MAKTIIGRIIGRAAAYSGVVALAYGQRLAGAAFRLAKRLEEKPPAAVEPDAAEQFRMAMIHAKLAMPDTQPEGADPAVKLRLRCIACMEPFDHFPRSEEEIEYIKRMLFICVTGYRPAICDGCLSNIQAATTFHLGGGSRQNFHDSPNFMLRHAARFPEGDPNAAK